MLRVEAIKERKRKEGRYKDRKKKNDHSLHLFRSTHTNAQSFSSRVNMDGKVWRCWTAPDPAYALRIKAN